MDENACSFDPAAANDSACLVDEGQFEPFVIQEPKKLTSPFVFSSPHSGRCYLKSFARASQLDLKTLRRSEDAFVDELFQKVSQIGAPLLRANASIREVYARPDGSQIGAVMVSRDTCGF